MNPSSSSDTEVLIVGAGPTGLVLALWLTRLGIRVRIVDKRPEPETTSRAVGVQARTLELYSQIGLAEAVIERGREANAINLWSLGRNAARFCFRKMGEGLSPYPFALVLPQDEHEQILINRLSELGVEVERRKELLGFQESGDRVLAQLKLPDGTEESCEVNYLAGCDGAHSAVREKLQIAFAGGTYTHLFYVADVQARGAAMNGELHVAVDSDDFLVIFPLKGEGRARLIGTIREDAAPRDRSLAWDDVSKRAIEGMGLEVCHVNWFSTFRVHHRVADHFRAGRAFLLGDAAHIHSPVGGQGMNTGIGDAVNLAWKLAATLRGRMDTSLLDTYEPERKAFALRLVDTTDRVFTGVTSPGAFARFARLKLVPFLLPILFKFQSVRHFMFRTVSQAVVNYRDSRLSLGRAGEVHGGDRLPWVRGNSQGAADNYASLTALAWQVHIYGEVSPEIKSLCELQKLPLTVFPWRSEMADAGLWCNALYLLRPDGYLALVDPEASPDRLASYLNAHGPVSDRSIPLQVAYT